MGLRLFIAAITAIILLFQPTALADSSKIQVLFNNQQYTKILAVQSNEIEEQEQFDFSKWQQKIQTVTSQIWENLPNTSSIDDFKTDFQSKLTTLEVIPKKITELQEWSEDLAGNISAGVDNIQSLSVGLAVNTKEKLDYIQKVSNDLATQTQEKVNDFQQWTNNLASNVNIDLSTLSDKLVQIQKAVGTEATPEEMAEMEQVEHMAVTLSQQLSRIQQNIEKKATPEEIAEIEKAKQIAATLSQQLSQIQKEVETEATPEEIAEIEQAEEITATLSAELNQMEQAAESTAILSEELEELNELQEAVAETEERIELSEEEVAETTISLDEEQQEIDESTTLTEIASEQPTESQESSQEIANIEPVELKAKKSEEQTKLTETIADKEDLALEENETIDDLIEADEAETAVIEKAEIEISISEPIVEVEEIIQIDKNDSNKLIHI